MLPGNLGIVQNNLILCGMPANSYTWPGNREFLAGIGSRDRRYAEFRRRTGFALWSRHRAIRLGTANLHNDSTAAPITRSRAIRVARTTDITRTQKDLLRLGGVLLGHLKREAAS